MSRETIYTIPINDVFEPKTGCPICIMRDMLEKRCVEYIMGAAMMEPDIRIETNKYGFCQTHFSMLSTQKNRLALALMLETHVDELTKKHLPLSVKKGEILPSESCYICNEVDNAMDKMLDTALKLYFADDNFKTTFLSQPFFCFPHYERLCKKSDSSLSKKQSVIFKTDITQIMNRYMSALKADIHSFSLMFDYRNAGKTEQDENVKNSIERGISFLTGR